MDIYAQIAMLQLAIMNHRLLVLDFWPNDHKYIVIFGEIYSYVHKSKILTKIAPLLQQLFIFYATVY